MRGIYTSVVRLFSLVLFSIASTIATAGEAQFDAYEVRLINAKFDEKAQIIQSWMSEDRAEALSLIQLMLASQLYYHKKEMQLYQVEDASSGAQALRLSDDAKVEIKSKRDFKRVSINNSLRTTFGSWLATAALNDPDPRLRREAALELIADPSAEVVAQVRELSASETDQSVKEAFAIVLAVADLYSEEAGRPAEAIDILSETLEPAGLAALTKFSAVTTDPELLKQANRAIDKISDEAAFYAGVETVYFGLSLGSVLVLAGIGLAITFGVMGVINMAHGELIMIGAYTTYVVQLLMPDHIEYSLFVAIPAAFVISGLVGIAIERGVIRFLYGRPLETLLATFGISLILQQAVRSIFSPLNRSVETPDWMSGSIQINPLLALTESRLYIIFFCLFVFFTLLMVMKRTRLGLQVRAVSQNRAMARAMGVRSEWVDAMTFGLGSGVAGVAGVALSQLTNVGPNLGQAYIIDSFLVVVFGGVGNLWGTLVAGLSLGLANKVMEPWAGAVLAKILVLVFIILFIQKRPRGLFPQRGRAAES
ncbi:MAG TPA: urea ABC transporter permease subunit UrtB [Marinobacterium sp.]|nr:urea ABC transporter permease subunit UrtB [Marinobacterium sp.]